MAKSEAWVSLFFLNFIRIMKYLLEEFLEDRDLLAAGINIVCNKRFSYLFSLCDFI